MDSTDFLAVTHNARKAPREGYVGGEDAPHVAGALSKGSYGFGYSSSAGNDHSASDKAYARAADSYQAFQIKISAKPIISIKY